MESRHSGHLVVADGHGAVVAALGDPDRPTFVRSAAKPFQAAACLDLLGPAPARLAPQHVAVAWSSHRGEARHLAAVAGLLELAATPPRRLTCPPARPAADPGRPARRIDHNCSGKHALFALAGRTAGCPHDRLLDPRGPLQRAVLAGLERWLGPAVAVAVDGCGAPAVAVPLRALARGYAALLADRDLDCVRAAGCAHPGLVGGHGRLETALLACGIPAKPGAEGIFGAAYPATDGPVGIAVKVEDGAGRAAGTALHALLVAARVVDRDVWSPPVVQGGERSAGPVRPAPPVAALAGGLPRPVYRRGW